MSAGHIVAAGLIAAGLGLVLISNLVFCTMLGEVNGNPGRRTEFGFWGMDILKFNAIWQEHRRLYPTSGRPRQLIVLFLLGVALCVAAICVLVF